MRLAGNHEPNSMGFGTICTHRYNNVMHNMDHVHDLYYKSESCFLPFLIDTRTLNVGLQALIQKFNTEGRYIDKQKPKYMWF